MRYYKEESEEMVAEITNKFVWFKIPLPDEIVDEDDNEYSKKQLQKIVGNVELIG